MAAKIISVINKLQFYYFLLISACAGTRSSSGDGPGMIVTFRNSMEGTMVAIVRMESNGISIPHLGCVPPSQDL